MMLEVVWSEKSQQSVQAIYDYYANFSIDVADNILDEIVQNVHSIKFSKQYQVDEVLPPYRRIIVRHYKILYRIEKDKIYIVDVLDSRRNIQTLE